MLLDYVVGFVDDALAMTGDPICAGLSLATQITNIRAVSTSINSDSIEGSSFSGVVSYKDFESLMEGGTYYILAGPALFAEVIVKKKELDPPLYVHLSFDFVAWRRPK